MERTHDTAIKIELPAPQRALPIATFRAVNGWWLICALILAIKLLLLWLNPTPTLFMGDSWSYIWTALTGWIPKDRISGVRPFRRRWRNPHVFIWRFRSGFPALHQWKGI